MPTYVLGDVHGCHATLVALLSRLEFDPDRDHLWLVGDLVNRGPASLEVLRWARALDDRMGGRFAAVLGNHDLHLIATAEGICAPRAKDRFERVLAAEDRDELLAWLASRPFLHRDGDDVMVHAGLLPEWTLEDAERLAAELRAEMSSLEGRRRLLGREPTAEPALARLREALRAFAYLRTMTAEGELCEGFSGPLEQAPPGCLPWFRVPGRKSTGARVACGHWAALGVHREAGVTALDSGCAWGGNLSALRLDDERLFQQKVLDRLA